MMALTLAHAGHWLVNVLYALPLLLVVGIIVRDRIKERRRAGSDQEDRN